MRNNSACRIPVRVLLVPDKDYVAAPRRTRDWETPALLTERARASVLIARGLATPQTGWVGLTEPTAINRCMLLHHAGTAVAVPAGGSSCQLG
jgi:hypothetical protein